MSRMTRHLMLAAIAALLTPATLAHVDLQWRAEQAYCEVGDTVRAGLYAVSDAPEGETFCAMQVVVFWDAAHMTFVGNVDPAPPVGWPWPAPWMASGFPDDAGLDDLNGDFTDGDAYFHLWCWLPRWLGDRESVGVATPEGTLITTFEFEATAAGDARLWIAAFAGEFSETAVLDDEIPGLNVVGELGEITLRILPFDVSGRTHELLAEWRHSGAARDGPLWDYLEGLWRFIRGKHEIETWGVEG